MAGRLGVSAPGPKRPATAGESTTVLAALSPEGVLASMRIEGPTNTEVFLTFLDQVLLPALPPGRIVVMDQLGRAQGRRGAPAHRSLRVPAGVFAGL